MSVAVRGQVWVCSCCGRRSRDREGTEKLDSGWDSSCMTHAVLCYAEPRISSSGKKTYWAVPPLRPN